MSAASSVATSKLIWLILSILWCVPLLASEHSATPYFQVIGADVKSVERLPLLQTKADIDISGTIASVTLRQTFENRGRTPIDAVYVFPASIRAAVSALTMTVGGRVVRGVIREKEQAKKEYAAAKESGRNAALLEEHDVGVFRMQLANILPGDRIDVELKYDELLLPREGQYEFFLPTTFGSDPYAAAGDRSAGQNSSDEPEVTDYSLSINVRLLGALPFTRIDSPSHHLQIDRPDPRRAIATLADDEVKAATRDFTLNFAYAGNDIANGLLLYPGTPENFFLLMTQPPKAPADALIPPREYIFVVDVSGSMIGAPLDLAKGLMRDLLHGLRPQDRFNVVLFSGGSKVLSSAASLPGSAENLERAIRLIDDQDSGGGTELIPALETAYALARAPGMARSIVIVTDGAIEAGGDAARLIRTHLNESNVFTFGVGAGVVPTVIQRLARAGAGEPLIVDDVSKGKASTDAFKRYIEHPVLTQVQVGFEGFDAYDVVPATVPDLFAERPIVLIGKYRGAAQGTIRVRGFTGQGDFNAGVEASGGLADAANSPLRSLWARAAIADKLDFASPSGYGGETEAFKQEKAEITALGLQYSVLTPYTSFVAVGEEVRTNEVGVQVQQPTPARAGVSYGSYSGGRGDALLAGVQLQAALASTVAVPPLSVSSLREVAGRRFHRDGTRWIDENYRTGQASLRIRRDSPAYARLLALRPDLREWLEFGDSVVLSLGRYAVIIDPRGFSDYPESVLRRALARR